MQLRHQIEQSLKDAMRAGDETRKRTIRLILAAMKLAEVDKGKTLDDDSLMAVIQKEVKIRKEAIEGAQQAGRPDLVEQTQNELSILEEFLPKQLDDHELDRIIQEAIKETGAASLSDTGKIMKVIMPIVKGRASGDRVSQAVKRALTPSG